MLMLATHLRQGLFVTLLLVVAPAVFTTARGDESCHKLVGHSFFADGTAPPLDFAEKRTDGIHLGQHLARGQRFEVTGLAVGDNADEDLTIRTQDGRTLNIMCSPFEDAMGTSPVGQRIIESNASDFETAMASAKAAAEKKAVQRGGVLVGMTEQQVLASWGPPDYRTATGEKEQWVYAERNFLYFENGILTAIQTQ